ncbi:MAG: SDR family oxidoreductase [Phycisphaerales bacterium JB043]
MCTQSTQVALITGAGTGIGRACALRLDALGFSTVLAGRRAGPLRSLATTLRNRAMVIPTDVCDPEQRERLVRESLESFGHVDVLINNAGSGHLLPLGRWTSQELLDAFVLNALSAAMLINDLWESLVSRQAGTIINITSRAVVDPFPGLGPYAAAKSAMGSLCRSVRNEGGHLGIRAFEIAPGAVETDLLRTIVSTTDLPESDTLDPDDVAQVVERLITGQLQAENGSQILI